MSDNSTQLSKTEPEYITLLRDWLATETELAAAKLNPLNTAVDLARYQRRHEHACNALRQLASELSGNP